MENSSDTLAYRHPPSDPAVAKIVDKLNQQLKHLPQEIERLRCLEASGQTLGELKGIRAEELLALYRIAFGLCDQGSFEHALPIALQLVLHAPQEARYSFMAGACLQRLKQHEAAALLYTQSLKCKPSDAAAAYRIGECLLAMGSSDEAKQVLEAAVELCRGKFEYRKLQDLANERLAAIAGAAH